QSPPDRHRPTAPTRRRIPRTGFVGRRPGVSRQGRRRAAGAYAHAPRDWAALSHMYEQSDQLLPPLWFCRGDESICLAAVPGAALPRWAGDCTVDHPLGGKAEAPCRHGLAAHIVCGNVCSNICCNLDRNIDRRTCCNIYCDTIQPITLEGGAYADCIG